MSDPQFHDLMQLIALVSLLAFIAGIFGAVLWLATKDDKGN